MYVEVLLRVADIAQDAAHTTHIALEHNAVYTMCYGSSMLRKNDIGGIACACTFARYSSYDLLPIKKCTFLSGGCKKCIFRTPRKRLRYTFGK